MVRRGWRTLESGRDDGLQLITRAGQIIVFVFRALDREARGRRAVAAAQTRHAFDRDVFARERVQFRQHFAGPGQVTRQIAADSQHDFLGRCEQKMGKETGHRLKPILRHTRLFRELRESLWLEVAEFVLNAVQRRNEHRSIQSQPFGIHFSYPDAAPKIRAQGVGVALPKIRGSLGIEAGQCYYGERSIVVRKVTRSAANFAG